MNRRAVIGRGLPVLGLILGLLLVAQGGWIQGKAVLAQILLQQAWAQTLKDGQVHKSWPWADHWPVAEISFPGMRASDIVLQGDGGNVLAFAPGHSPHSGMPGEPLTTVISGHRDTHFRLLEKLKSGDLIDVTTRAGRFHYRVNTARVVDRRKQGLRLHETNELVLVTCWPFTASVVGGPLRYVVYAVPVRPADAGHSQAKRQDVSAIIRCGLPRHQSACRIEL